MKAKFTLILSALLVIGMVYDYNHNRAITYTGGPPAGNAGAPGEGHCGTACHAGGPAATDESMMVTTDIPPSGYSAFGVYNVTVTMTKAGVNKFGFQLTAKNSGGTALGTFTAVSGSTQVMSSTHITHVSGSTAGTGTNSWSFTWQAPTSGSGDLGFYYAGNFADGMGGASGDVIVTGSEAFSEYEFIAWDGSTSTDWNVGTNWNGDAVPTASDNVFIPSDGNQPQVTSDPGTPAVCADLNLEAGSTLTINAGKALTVSGATSNAGTITVEADATGVGSFVDNGTLSIVGAGVFEMEQYLTGSGGATPDGRFWYVSSPLSSGPISNVYDAAGDNRLWFASEGTQSYFEISDNASGVLPGLGAIVALGATDTYTFAGTFNTGVVSASGLPRTGTTETNRGYNLVGNPYPSTVNWNSASKTNLETSIWYRTNNGSSMVMDTYNTTGNVGTNNNGGGDVTNMIPPTQAFWVRVDADGSTGQLDFDNADRSHGTWASIYKTEQEEGNIRIALSDGSVSDEQIVLFNPSAMDGYDDFDSQKFWSSNVPQLYTHVEDDTLTINGLSSSASNPSLDLGMKIATSGEHTLNATAITFTETPVHLEDRLLNVFQNLNTNPVYAFTSDAGNIGDRFVLHFSAITGVEEGESSIQVFAVNNALQINLNESKPTQVTVLDLSGRTVYTENFNADRNTIALDKSSGIYLVRVETEGQHVTKKVFIK